MNQPSDETPAVAVTLPGTVEKVLKSAVPDQPDKAQIAVDGADHLYREIRIENVLHTDQGEKVELKVGAQVDVTIQAPPDAVVPKEVKK